MIENNPESSIKSKEIEEIKMVIADKSEGLQKRAIEFYLKNTKPVELTPGQVLEY